jgi:glycosyltransferase involved in cell wall biosynthesis
MNRPVYFAIPGDINRLTGGYGYDRRLIAELTKLGFAVQHLPLANSFPEPDDHALRDAETQLAKLPVDSLVIIDGLAFGAMASIAEHYAKRLTLIALCHHPLALETGLTAERVQAVHMTEQRALAAATAVLVTSNYTAGILQQTFAVPASKISVALPGTDKQQFAPCIGNPPILLTVATLTPRKAHDTLIDALAQVAHLPWQARFVGGDDFDCEWATYLRSKVASHSLTSRIAFVGNVTDPGREYAQADVFVLPSLFEGYGMAFAEALSFGLPVIAARTGAVPDLVPASAGLLVPPAKAVDLAEALTQLLTDPARRHQLQLGAQQVAHRLPTWADTAGIVGHLIQQVQLMNKCI